MGFGLIEIFWSDCKDHENIFLIFEEVSQTKGHNVNCVVGRVPCFLFPFHCISQPDFIFQELWFPHTMWNSPLVIAPTLSIGKVTQLGDL